MTRKSQSTGHDRYKPFLAGLALTVCFAAGLGAGALLWRGGQDTGMAAADVERQTRLVSGGYDAAELLLVAAENLAQERGLTYAALKSSGQISEETRNGISTARGAADRALTQSLTLVNGHLEFDRDSSFMRKVAKSHQTLKEMRAELDSRIRSADRTDNVDFADKWFAQSSRLMITSEELLELVHSKIRSIGLDIDSAVALKLQRLAMILVDYVGRERGAMSGAIAENERFPNSFSNWVLPAYRGRIGGIWTSIKAAADSNSLSPEITLIIARIDQDYFGDMEQLRQAIQKADTEGKPYPVSAEEWFTKASTVISSLVSLGQEAGQLARTRSDKLRKTV